MRRRHGMLAAVLVVVSLVAALLVRPSLGKDAGTEEDAVQVTATNMGGCGLPRNLPKSVTQEAAFQAELWRFSLRTYPQCKVIPGALARADRQMRQVSRTPFRMDNSGTILPDGTGETGWGPLGPVGIDKYWGITSGRVNAIAVDPTNASTIFLGADNGGIWKSTDGGLNWSAVSSSAGDPNISALAIDPSNPSTIYAGTGNGLYALYGNGILKSTDGGLTWSAMGGSTFSGGIAFHKIAVDPVNGSIWAATTSGLYRSADGGSTWTSPQALGLPAEETSDVTLDPVDHTIVYAAVGSPWGSDAKSGIYESTDGGQIWAFLAQAPNGDTTTSAGSTHVGRIELGVANPAGGSHIVYARVEDDTDSTLYGFFRSTDGGSTWSQMSNPNPGHSTYWYYDGMLVDPSDPTGNTVWAGGLDVFKTTDGGSMWTQVSNVASTTNTAVHVDQHALAAAGSTILAGNDGGVYSTSDGGATWTSRNDTLGITELYSGAVDGTGSPVTIGGSQDNGAERTNTDPANLRWNLMLGGDGTGSAVDFSNPQTYYIDYIIGRLMKSTDGGSTFGDITYTDTSGIPRSDLDNACWYAPFPMDPTSSSHFIFGTREVWESKNAGQTWTQRSPDLTSASGCIASLAIAPTAPKSAFYAGTTNGKVWVTTNDGSSWRDISAGLPGSTPTSIAVDPTNSKVAFVTMGSCQNNGCIYRTPDGGTTWQNVSGNLPNFSANAVVVDPVDPLHLYVGTDESVFESTNLGRSWTNLNIGLPVVPIDGLYLNHSGTLLSAATYGRGMFRLYRSWITLGVTSGLPGSTLPITGQGYVPHETVNILFNGSQAGTAAADANGAIRTSIPVPNLTRGAYTVDVQGVTSGRLARKTFTIGKTLTVSSTADSSVCSSSRYTLRCAITAANADGAPDDLIAFNIPSSDPGCTSATAHVCTISLSSALPTLIAKGATIDGYTQPGAAPSSNGAGVAGNAVIRIRIAGASLAADGLTIAGSGNTIRGLSIGGFSGNGINITGANTVIQGNFVGLSPDLTALTNRSAGIYLHNGATGSTVGGIAAASSNAIADNGGPGVLIGAAASDTTNGIAVQGNGIYGNGGLGIALAPAGSVNCSGPHAGPNDYTPCPIVASTSPQHVAGTACPGCSVDVFVAGNEATARGHGQGKTYLGTTQADSSGNWSLAVPAGALSGGTSLTATATTTPTVSVPAETSEFASNVAVGRLVVTTTADSSSPCSPQGVAGGYSLRCAITNANSDGSGDTIAFNIPASDPGCVRTTIQGTSVSVCTITEASGFPQVNAKNTTVDGYTQPGSRANTGSLGNGDNAILAIHLNGGFTLAGTGQALRGLAILNFNYGILIGARGYTGNTVTGCFIGTDGTNAQGGTVGIYVASGSSNNIIGGTTPQAANVVSGNQDGILIGAGSGNLVEGNYVGTDSSGRSALRNAASRPPTHTGNGALALPITKSGLPNGNGVLVFAGAGNTTIGGTASGSGNVVAFNGTGIGATSSTRTIITGNILRSNSDGVVEYGGESGDTIVQNTITNSSDAGIAVGSSATDAVHAVISRNSISGSGGLGIDLAPIGSVTCTGGSGSPNDGTPCPTIATAGSNRVAGSACSGCRVEIFKAIPNSLGHGDGVSYLGYATATSGGAWSFTASTVTSGTVITATATTPTSPGPSETSEYAANVTAS